MKKLLLLSFFLFFFGQLYAQSDPARDELNHIFQYIDKSQIPYGYLDDYGPQLLDKRWQNGVLADSNFIPDIRGFRYLYNDIENSRIYSNAPTLTSLETLNTTINQLSTGNATPLIFLIAKYATLREDAIQQNLFTYSNNQIFDVSGRSQSPYIEQDFFAAVPIKEASSQNNIIELSFNPNLFYTNYGKTVSAVSINFLDGLGYQSIPTNGSVSKSYSDSSGYKRFTIRLRCTDGSIYYCYSHQYVKVISGGSFRYAPLTPAEISNPTHVIPDVPGQYKGARIYVRYSTKRNGTSLQDQIVKPFIIVEGYDIHDVAPKLQETNYDINKLIRE